MLLALGCAGQRKTDEREPAESRILAAPAPTVASAQVVAAPSATVPPTPVQPVAVAVAVAPGVASEPRCREQPAQDFLLRKGQIAKIGAPAAERRAIEAARKRSIDYRTRTYGRFPGVGSAGDNSHPPRFYSKLTKFMGLPVVLNEKVVPALGCVETAIVRECAEFKYRPKSLGGIRLENTFNDGEVSNHVYGIAIDIDPDRNPCCGCVGTVERARGSAPRKSKVRSSARRCPSAGSKRSSATASTGSATTSSRTRCTSSSSAIRSASWVRAAEIFRVAG